MWWSGSKVTDKQLLMQLWRTQSQHNHWTLLQSAYKTLTARITTELKIWEQTRKKKNEKEKDIKLWSGSQTNHSFEPVLFSELVESVHWIRLKRLKEFAARAAQIYKLLDQNSLSDAWQSLRLQMNELIQRKQFDSDRRLMSRWDAHAWTKHLNEGVKLKILWFLTVYVKRWADED